jgi:hypothetical protein
MGWMSEDSRHEGHLEAVRQVDGFWRDYEAGAPWLPELDVGTHPVEYVQAVCSCGWRSPRMVALGARWAPSSVDALPLTVEEGQARWREHVEAESRRE